MEHTEILKRHPFFETFPPASLARIVEASKLREFGAHEHVIRHGTTTQHLGVIVQGACAVLVPDDADGDAVKRQIATLTAKEMFGEMGLLTGEPAVADVIAEPGTQVVLVPHQVVSVELAQSPKSIQFLGRIITERLRRRSRDEREERDVEQARKDARRTRNYQLAAQPGLAPRVLVLNLGSSSLKYDFFDAANPSARSRGQVDKVGEKGSRHTYSYDGAERSEEVAAPDQEAALAAAIQRLTDPKVGVVKDLSELTAVGHRVVHGGARYSEAVVIDDAVIREVEGLCKLAPLHNPVALAGIRACQKLLPGVPQVAVFDTAFHATLPDHAYTYAIPHALAEKHGLRRYGFHGTSHKYVAQRAAAYLQRSSRDLKLITCHLGSGASICAIEHGRAVDTTMGLTPLEGLVMGTRSGDVDPGLLLHLSTSLGMSSAEVEKMLNRESGLLGLSGLSKDMRELERAAADGNPRARLAISVFCHRVKKYIGAYVAVLGGLDALVFTAGIGQGSSWIRARVCQGLAAMGVEIDEMLNRAPATDPQAVRQISAPSARVPVLVIPTDEEAMIARETMSVLGLKSVTEVLRRTQDLPIPINISAHHAHLAQDDVEALFGKGRKLTRRSDLMQPGQFACEETVTLVGPKGEVERVRVLGPARKQTQVEISRTEEFKLGIDAPVRASGDIEGSPGLTLRGSQGEVKLDKGAICAMRHIHMSPEDALRFALRDMDLVRVRAPGDRSLIFGDVLIRVSPDFVLEMHIDTDEANAAELGPGARGFLEGIQSRRN